MIEDDLKHADETIARLRVELAAERDENEQLKDIQRQVLAASDANASANKRLRELIKRVEYGYLARPGACPWCGWSLSAGDASLFHAPDCTAFTPQGDVR